MKDKPAFAMIFCLSFLALSSFVPQVYGRGMGRPPQEAISACKQKNSGDSCRMTTPRGQLNGRCAAIQNQLACVPRNHQGRAGGGNQSKQQRTYGGSSEKTLMDVHGAGAQRSDPKSGTPANFPYGHGPQGDVISIYNYARCVRDHSPASLTYAVADTGQTECYDDGRRGAIPCPRQGEPFAGQDAQHKGLAASYKDNNDGTVTDMVTGLMWQKEFSKASFRGAAKAAAASQVGGYDDWRVPTIKELYSLMNFNGQTGTGNFQSSSVPSDAIPYLNTQYFSFEYPTNTGRFIDAQYLTGTAYASTVMQGQRAFFGVNFADGRIKGYPQAGNAKRSEYYVRFVRDNPKYGNNNFRKNNQTITDLATGLQWMTIDSGHPSLKNKGYTKNNGTLNWKEALQFCENLTYDKQSDWRLPDTKELHTIVDYSRSPDTTNSAAISPIFSITAIKDPAGNKDYPFFWTSTTHRDGRNEGERAVYIAFGEAKGYMPSMGGRGGGMGPGGRSR